MVRSTEAAIIYVIGTLTFLVFIFFLILILIEYSRRQMRHLREKLTMEHRYQSQVLQTKLEVQEQSFKYISEEIHDNIAQTLSLARLKLYKTAERNKDNALSSSLDTSIELVGNALNDLRNLSHVLNGSLILKLTLKESIEKELQYVGDAKEIHTSLVQEGTVYEPEPEKKLIVFRIVQEAIGNAIKHGEATKIKVTLTYLPENIKISIEDNGKGFDTKQVENSKGLGLHNMHVRARLLGDLTITSEHNTGTIITLNINMQYERKN